MEEGGELRIFRDRLPGNLAHKGIAGCVHRGANRNAGAFTQTAFRPATTGDGDGETSGPSGTVSIRRVES